jgi:hypothetical protein
MKAIFSIFFALLIYSNSYAMDAQKAKYNEVVTYEEGRAITYPDFKITYKGKTSAEPNGKVAKFTFRNFVVESKSGKQDISWSSGTGDIAEEEFIVNGKKFYLDLAPRKNRRYLNSGKQDLIIHDEEGYRGYGR